MGDFHFISDFDGGADGEHFLAGSLAGEDFMFQGFHEGVGHGWDAGSEPDEAADALAEGHGTFHFADLKLGEDVSGEKRLDPPDFPAAGGFAVAKARAEDFDAFEGAQVFCGDVFALGLATDAEPFGDAGAG